MDLKEGSRSILLAFKRKPKAENLQILAVPQRRKIGKRKREGHAICKQPHSGCVLRNNSEKE